jgi:hypothetical protein
MIRVAIVPAAALGALWLGSAAARATVYPPNALGTGADARYFDAHNHISGILPYYAFANLPAYIASFSDAAQTVSAQDRLAYYQYLADVWYPKHQAELDHKLFSPPDGQRFAIGGRAALVVYRDRVAGSVAALNAALERILTATPWSEFDSAYAFRGAPTDDYMQARFYSKNPAQMSTDLCKATELELARTHIDVSEQSMSFIGGWQYVAGQSERLNTILCFMSMSSDPTVQTALRAMGRTAPSVKFVYMTHTAQLATLPGGMQYLEWSKSGTCAAAPLPWQINTSPGTIYNALLGQNDGGAPIVAADQLAAFYDTVVGIDTASVETTCFTPDGMSYYKQLIDAVYDASKERRRTGWHGKLLVHTHVGEGAVIDYSPTPPASPWTFRNTFATLPPTRSNADQAHANIALLLAAIAEAERAHPDLHDYVVFRLAHVTWATADEAALMHDERVEADVSLESNVATGSYPIARMPLTPAVVMANDINPIVGDMESNFALNNLLGVLVADPTDDLQVGAILGDASLKFLLEKHVRCILGTDGDGVEHSDIVKEYQYASSLIGYWYNTDPNFKALAGNVDTQTLYDNARWHLDDMSMDSAQPY